MNADRSASPSPGVAGVPSARVRLARLALETALATDGVAAGDPGRLQRWQTEHRGEMLPGVVATAREDARFDVELHLVASWPPPPLHEVAGSIRRGVAEAALAAGLDDALGEQMISFRDVLEPPPGTMS